MSFRMSPQDHDLRFWACAIDENIQGADRKALIEKLKEAGFKPTVYGFKAKIAAIGHMTRVKQATGIELEIFKHDYLF